MEKSCTHFKQLCLVNKNPRGKSRGATLFPRYTIPPVQVRFVWAYARNLRPSSLSQACEVSTLWAWVCGGISGLYQWELRENRARGYDHRDWERRAQRTSTLVWLHRVLQGSARHDCSHYKLQSVRGRMITSSRDLLAKMHPTLRKALACGESSILCLEIPILTVRMWKYTSCWYLDYQLRMPQPHQKTTVSARTVGHLKTSHENMKLYTNLDWPVSAPG